MPDVWKSNYTPPRIEGRRSAVLIDSQGCESKVVVIDMSGSSFRVESAQEHFVGELVRLRVGAHVEYAGEIRWVLGSQIGGIILEPVQTPWDSPMLYPSGD